MAGPQLTATLSLNGKDFEAGIKKAEKQAKDLEGKLKRMVFKLGALVVGGLSIKGFATGIKDAYQYAREMENFSRATGIARDRAAEFDLALKDSMLDANQLQVALRLMSQRLLKAAEGDKVSQNYFQQLSLSFRELIHLTPDEAFLKVGEALTSVKNRTLASAQAIRIFGDTGAKVFKMFERDGAMEMAGEALGGQRGILARSGQEMEKIAIRLSHISVKIRGFFLGVADAILPTMEKFTDLFHKMDFTGWGAKFGNAMKDAMAWVVTFWNEPAKTTEYFWEYSKGKAMELGEVLGEAIARGIERGVPAWLKALSVAIQTGQTGAGMVGASMLNSWQGMGGGSGTAMDDYEFRRSRELAGIAPLGGRSQSADQLAHAATLRPNAAHAAAQASLGTNRGPRMGIDTQEEHWRFRGFSHNLGQPTSSSLQGASMAGTLATMDLFKSGKLGQPRGLSLSSMHSGAYGASPLLRHGEMKRFRNAAIAARSGHMLANGHDPRSLGAGEDPSDFHARRRPGETANGDRRRAKAMAKEIMRKELHQGTDSQKLGDISEYTKKTADNTAVFAK